MRIPGIKSKTYWDGTTEEVRNEFIKAFNQYKKDLQRLDDLRFKYKVIPLEYKGISEYILHGVYKLLYMNFKHRIALKEYKKGTFYDELYRNHNNYALIVNLYLFIEILKLKKIW